MRKKYNIEDVLQVGENLIREKGYHNTGINDILKVSGVPKGSFYNFFESKDDFGVKMLQQYGAKMMKYMEVILGDKSKCPLDRLKLFYQIAMQANATEKFKMGCLLNNLSSELGGTNDRIAIVADEEFNKWLDLIAGCIEEGQERGEIIDHHSARELAQYLHANFFGAISRAKVTKTMQPLELAHKMTFEFLEKR